MSNREQQLALYLQSFKQMNKVMMAMWHLGLGKIINAFPRQVGQIMVLTHTGRKSGKTYRNPLNYALIDDELYLVAGFGSTANWYKNVVANPQVEVWLPNSWWAGEARDVTLSDDRLQILRAILKASGFAAEAFEGINPETISDEDLEKFITEYDYRLVHIQRTEAKTGDGGPGEYSWVWFVVSLVLFLQLITRRK